MEVEIKLKIENVDDVMKKLKNFEFLGERKEEDTYYNYIENNGCCRDFARTDEAIRVRKSDGVCILTYKGPRVGKGEFKAREEVEVEVSSCDAIVKILQKLCLKPVITITKHRRYWRRGDVTVTLDYVEGLGWFLEIEVIGEISKASELISKIREEIAPDSPEVKETYLEMLLMKTKQG